MKNLLRALVLWLGLVVGAFAVPPTVTLTAPANGGAYGAPATVTLTANAADADGIVAKVEFFHGATKLGESITPASPDTFTFPYTFAQPGAYALTARATDNSGATTTSAPVTVNVLGGLPFLANFEPGEGYVPGSLAGQKGWSVAGSASVVTSPVVAGQQSVSVAPAASPAVLSRLFANGNPGVTFVDLFALPGAARLADLGVFFETDTAAVALTSFLQMYDGGGMIFGAGLQEGDGAGAETTGLLEAFDGNGAGGGTWRSTLTGPALDASGRSAGWMRLTTRHDFARKKWDLYFNGRMIAADLGFLNNSSASFSSLGLVGHTSLATGFDGVLVAFDNPLFVDVDQDGLDDAWEISRGLNPAHNDRNGDPDGDGLTNLQEFQLGTHPQLSDSDGDGVPDGVEKALGSDPTVAGPVPALLNVDLDGDGLNLAQEVQLGTDPNNRETDGDGLPDGWESRHNLDPLVAASSAVRDSDADGDGLSLLQEAVAGTDPNGADTDGDGATDAWEARHGLNPLADDSALDLDGDGVTNRAELERNTDPQDYYNGITPVITNFIGGQGDLGAGNLLAVRVTDRAGHPLVNAPVVFEFPEGNTQIALTPDGPLIGRTAVARTDAVGIARVYLRAP